MSLYPKLYLKNATEITMKMLNENNIKGILIDVDNTLIDFDKNLLVGAKEWIDDLKKNKIKICILSNTNKIEKVKKAASQLDIPYINFAKKPFKKGFLRGKQLLGLNENEIAVVGDQIFTDILGGNRVNMFTILTKPIDKRDIFITRFKRPFERIVINKYLKKQEKKNVF